MITQCLSIEFGQSSLYCHVFRSDPASVSVMGRPSKPPGAESRSKIKRICGAESCKEEIRGTDLGKHYKSKTDFRMLTVLKTLPLESAEEKLKQVDTHTAFMFKNGHSQTNLPKWNTHTPKNRKPIPAMFKPKVTVGDNNQNAANLSEGKHDEMEVEVAMGEDKAREEGEAEQGDNKEEEDYEHEDLAPIPGLEESSDEEDLEDEDENSNEPYSKKSRYEESKNIK